VRFLLFPKLKSALKKRFDDITVIEKQQVSLPNLKHRSHANASKNHTIAASRHKAITPKKTALNGGHTCYNQSASLNLIRLLNYPKTLHQSKAWHTGTTNKHSVDL
jgi:hypothetical protein